MKLIAFFMIIGCLQVSARGYSQHTVTLNEQNAPLKKVFKEIRDQTGYDFIYNTRMLKNARPVTIQVKDANLAAALDLCFARQPFTYTIVENTIVIKEKATAEQEPQVEVLPPLSIDVTGRVTNTGGEPLAGASVVIRRTGKGVIADANGQFKLRDVSSDDIIVVSYIGYKTLSIKVGDQTNFILVMEVADSKLDEMVVQAYGKTTQRLATGSISRITAEDISKQPVMNVLNVLQGQIPGAVVTNASGYASGTVKVEIRGRNTINPGFTTEPLYVIDGVPLTILDVAGTDNYFDGSQGVLRSGINSPASGQSPIFSLNPADIESIEILKDADATAIYGSRASNGVILITTKKGKAEKTNFDFTLYQGFQKIITRYKVLNTQQYVEMRKEALANDNYPLDVNNAPDLTVWDTTRNIDWQKYLYGSLGKVTDAQGTISGGSSLTTFRIGAGYRHQTDLLTISGSNNRGSLSLNLNHRSLNQRLGMSFSAQYSTTAIDIISSPGATLLPPNAPDVFDANGRLNYAGWLPLDYVFPFSNLLQPYESNTNFLNSNLDLHYELIKGLTIKSSFGYNNVQNSQKNLITIASQNPQYNPKGQVMFGNSFIRNLIVEPQMEYTTFIGKNKLNILIGTSWQSNETNSINASGSGYTKDVLMSSINGAPSKFISMNKGEYKYAAVFARLNYNFKNKYILNLNARKDGSTKFAPGRQYGNFGSVGAAYIFSEENWIKNHLSFLSFGKIRSSYGITGGDQITDYAYRSQWAFQNAVYNQVIPLIATSHTDSLLQWQVNKKLEVSLSLGFLKDRITIEANWYQNRCNNQLVQFPVPVFTGFGSVVSNSPANVQNSGYEIIVNSKVFDNKNFKWTLIFNGSANRNKLLSYPNFSQSPYFSQLTIGKSLNIIKVLHYTNVDPQTGYYQFEDKNKDGNISIDYSGKTKDDRYDLDRSTKFDGGFKNTFLYKNWELSIFFYFRKQLGLNAFAVLDAAGTRGNQPEEVFLNHWKKPGDISDYAKFTTDPGSNISYTNFFFFSDGKYTDASFIRLQNLSLSYSIPDKLNKKIILKNTKIFIQGQNLLLITRYKGSDPELQAFGALPIPKIVTLGISCHL